MLTDIQCRKATPRDKAYKLSDAHGLYLYVLPTGTRSWRLKYRFGSKEHRLTFGTYPEVSLIAAREMREEVRKQLREGIDPKVDKKKKAAIAALNNGNTFEAIALDWHKQQAAIRAPRYANQILARLQSDVFPTLGPLPIREITPPLVLMTIRGIEARGSIEMAHRVRQHMSAVFTHAIGLGWTDANPAQVIQPVLAKRIKTRRPAVLTIEQAQQVIIATEDLDRPYWATLLASRLLALTAARPGVLRLAEPREFEQLDGPEPIWRIPAEKMKLTREQKRDLTLEFVIPLSVQATSVVKTALQLSAGKKWLFPTVRGTNAPISDSTLSKLYRLAGLSGMHVPHGWRSTFSTLMNQRAAIENRVGDREVIDLMLAHLQEGIEPIYNRYAYMPRRRELAQEWADMLLQGLPSVSDLLKG